MPRHEIVQAAVLFDHRHPRAQHQVKGVAQQDLYAQVRQGRRRQSLDRTVGAAGHEDGSLDDTVRQCQPAAPCFAIGRCDFELQRLTW